MTHSTHDLALIAGLAAGESDPQAEALVATCELCAEEYREQLAMKGLLAEISPATLNADEARLLRERVMGSLSTPVVDELALRRKPLSPVWGRLTAVAAAIAGITLVGAVVTSGGGAGSATTSSDDFALIGQSSDMRAAATTAAATAEASGGAADSVMLAPDESFADLKGQAQELLDQARSGNVSTTAAPAAEAESCELPPDLEIVTQAQTTLNERPVVIVIVETEAGLVARAFYTDDCSEITLS
jgi:hypothetical protein